MIAAAYVQFEPQNGEVRANLEMVERIVGSFSGDVLVLPELFSTGYLFDSAAELAPLAEQIPDGEACEFLRKLSQSTAAAVIAGLAEKTRNHLFNSAVLVTPDGTMKTYRKAHLFHEEKRLFAPGDTAIEVHTWKDVRLGMMVCFDWIFPEMARSLALKGADILCHPANLVTRYGQAAMVTRCVENRVFAITANRTGIESKNGRSLSFSGASQIISPDGDLLAHSGRETAELVSAQIHVSLSRDKLFTPLNDIFKDRRTDLYTL